MRPHFFTEPMTVFAPTNEAFKFLRENSEWKMNMNHEMMKKMLGRVFVLHRKILPYDIENEMIVDTLSGEKLRLNVYPRVNNYSYNKVPMYGCIINLLKLV